MANKNIKFYSFLLVIVDSIVLLTSFVVAYVLRVKFDPRPLVNEVYAMDYFFTFIAIVPLWIIIFGTLGLYSQRIYNHRLQEWSRIFLGSFIGILMVIGWGYVSGREFFPARLVPVYAFIGAFIMIVLEREAFRAIRTLLFRYGHGVQRVLIIGNSPTTSDVATSLSDTAHSGYKIVALAGPKSIMPAGLNAYRYSLPEMAVKNIERDDITAIIQTDLFEDNDRNQKILNSAQFNHINYSFIPGNPEFYSGKNMVDVFLGYPIITVFQTPLVGWGAIAKRGFDIIVSGLLIILLSPIFLVVMLLQKILNPGPIFYVSTRLSRFSEAIPLIKFRSMDSRYGKRDATDDFRSMGRPDLVEEYEKKRKVENDPRITKFGKILRTTSIDELPQLFNVWMGHLSLVGPRPILPQELKYVKNKTSLLHSVKSGVTGLWQVSGRNDLSFDERIDLETFYVQNWSLWFDIKILFKTVAVVLFQKGAK